MNYAIITIKGFIMKDITGFEGLYSITEDGQVWSHPKKSGTSPRPGKWLKPLPLKNTGYLRVCLSLNQKYHWRYIHRLVALTFIKPVPGKRLINHKDGIKTNNKIDNLEWANHSDNLNHAYAIGTNKSPALSKEQVVEIKRLYSKGDITQAKLAEMFNTSQALVSKLIRGEAYKWQ